MSLRCTNCTRWILTQKVLAIALDNQIVAGKGKAYLVKRYKSKLEYKLKRRHLSVHCQYESYKGNVWSYAN